MTVWISVCIFCQLVANFVMAQDSSSTSDDGTTYKILIVVGLLLLCFAIVIAVYKFTDYCYDHRTINDNDSDISEHTRILVRLRLALWRKHRGDSQHMAAQRKIVRIWSAKAAESRRIAQERRAEEAAKKRVSGKDVIIRVEEAAGESRLSADTSDTLTTTLTEQPGASSPIKSPRETPHGAFSLRSSPSHLSPSHLSPKPLSTMQSPKPTPKASPTPSPTPSLRPTPKASPRPTPTPSTRPTPRPTPTPTPKAPVTLPSQPEVTVQRVLTGLDAGHRTDVGASASNVGCSPSIIKEGCSPSITNVGCSPSVIKEGCPPSITNVGCSPSFTKEGCPPSVIKEGCPPSVIKEGCPPSITNVGCSPSIIKEGCSPSIIKEGCPPSITNVGCLPSDISSDSSTGISTVLGEERRTNCSLTVIRGQTDNGGCDTLRTLGHWDRDGRDIFASAIKTGRDTIPLEDSRDTVSQEAVVTLFYNDTVPQEDNRDTIPQEGSRDIPQ